MSTPWMVLTKFDVLTTVSYPFICKDTCHSSHVQTLVLSFVSLCCSGPIQVPADGQKVRRSTPLADPQDVDEQTVYVEDLPQETTTESMERDFGRCGSVEYIQ